MNKNTENKLDEIRLDGEVITLEQLHELKKDRSIRIIEDGEGKYKTLKKLNG